MDQELRTVKPYGILYTTMETYYLLSPHPVPGDSWERDNCYRFVVTPIKPEAVEQKGYKTAIVHGYARHIVTNSFTIEYRYNILEINLPILNELDLTQPEYPIEEDKNDNEENFPF